LQLSSGALAEPYATERARDQVSKVARASDAERSHLGAS